MRRKVQISYATCPKVDENERITRERIGKREWPVHSSFGRGGIGNGPEANPAYIGCCPCIFVSVYISIYMCIVACCDKHGAAMHRWPREIPLAQQKCHLHTVHAQKDDEHERITRKRIGNREWRAHSSFCRGGPREWARGESGVYRLPSVCI